MTTLTIPTITTTKTKTLILTTTTSVLTTLLQNATITVTETGHQNNTLSITTPAAQGGGITTTVEAIQVLGFVIVFVGGLIIEFFICKKRNADAITTAYSNGRLRGGQDARAPVINSYA